MRGRNFNGLGGLSGHASSMITSLKNNLRRKEQTRFKTPSKKTAYKEKSFDKKTTSKQLKDIRERIQKENKERFIKNAIVIIILASIIIYAIGFVEF